MVAVSVVVFSADGRTPDFVSVVGAEVGDHNNNTFAGDTSFTAAVAGRGTGGCQVVAFTAAAATPGGVVGVKEGLGTGGGVDAS